MLVSRRSLLGGAAALALAGCAETSDYLPPPGLQAVLAALPSLATEADLMAKLGRPDYLSSFLTEEGPLNYYRTREEWRKLYSLLRVDKHHQDIYDTRVNAHPENLFDTAPAGTRLAIYEFTNGDSLNPWGPPLFVFLDQAGKVMGWTPAWFRDAGRYSLNHGVRRPRSGPG